MNTNRPLFDTRHRGLHRAVHLLTAARSACAAAVGGIALAIGSPANANDVNEVLLQAMRDELARSMQSLSMEDMGKPYFLAPRDPTTGFGDLEQADTLVPRWVLIEF